KKNPLMGCGPNQWPMIASSYGWPHGKEAHSLWVQTGAELGLVGLALYLGFYLSVLALLWQLTWKRTHVSDPWYKYFARMSFTGLCGFVVSAQFVSLESLEIPYYTALLGLGVLKLTSRPRYLADLEEFEETLVGNEENDGAPEFVSDGNEYEEYDDEFSSYPEFTSVDEDVSEYEVVSAAPSAAAVDNV
ncbi:MAG: hypothetical protein ACI93T_003701, partial [Porticoccaceae bacterium]